MCFDFVKKELKSYNLYKATVKDLEIRLNSVDNELTYISSKELTSENIHTNKFNSSVENTVMKKEHLIEKLEIEKRRNEIQVQRIDNALSVLDDRSRDILIDIYINNKKIDDIAYKNDLSYSRILQLKREALKKIEKYLVTTTVSDLRDII